MMVEVLPFQPGTLHEAFVVSPQCFGGLCLQRTDRDPEEEAVMYTICFCDFHCSRMRAFLGSVVVIAASLARILDRQSCTRL